ncbi:MAG: hypothetical protein JXR96_06720 [Deltaproteobacteria bacterium]|nr:hypothetical protein [Deltaproteobacteria bacterium]
MSADSQAPPGRGPLDELRRERRERDRAHGRLAWGLVGAAVLALVLLGLWMHSLQQSAAPAVDAAPDGGESQTQPEPDGSAEPGPSAPVPFRTERCRPWHVSAVREPPDARTRLLVLTSRIADPYGLVLAGFAEACAQQRTLLLEDLAPGGLREAVARQAPAAILAVGTSAVQRAQAEAPGTRLLFALVPNPMELGLDRGDAAGVSQWVPVEAMMRRVLTVLPRSRERLAVIFAPAMQPCAAEAAAAIAADGRQAVLCELGEQGVDGAIEAASATHAWVVFPDRSQIDAAAFHRIQVAAEERKIPVAVSDEAHVRAGAFVGVGVDSTRVGRQLCRLAGALIRDELPAGSNVFCPEYSFAAVHFAVVEKLGYILDHEQLRQAKIYRWH